MPSNPYGPDWPAVGARVAEYLRADFAPSIVTVTRKTVTMILTDGPRRYNPDTLGVVGADNWYALRPLTDPDVAYARARGALNHVVATADRMRRTAARAEGISNLDATAAYRAALRDIADMAAAVLADLDDTAEHPADPDKA